VCSSDLWQELEHGEVDKTKPVCIAVDRTMSWDHASIIVGQKTETGYVTELIASISRPDKTKLLDVCLQLASSHQAVFAIDGYINGELGFELERALNQCPLNVIGRPCSGFKHGVRKHH